MDRFLIIKANKIGLYLQERGTPLPAILSHCYSASIVATLIHVGFMWDTTERNIIGVSYLTVISILWGLHCFDRWRSIRMFSIHMNRMDEDEVFHHYALRAGRRIVPSTGLPMIRKLIVYGALFFIFLCLPDIIIGTRISGMTLSILMLTMIVCEYADTILPAPPKKKHQETPDLVPNPI